MGEHEHDFGKEYEAGEGVGSLGMAFTGMPPGYPEIKKVVPGSWADDMGIEVGWIFIEVNGEDLMDMPKETFMQHLKARPVILYLEPPTPPPSDSEKGTEAEDDKYESKDIYWRYQPEEGVKVLDIQPRLTPDVKGERSKTRITAGTVFKVRAEKLGADGVKYLELADGSGWLFDRIPEVGRMCFFHAETAKGQELAVPQPRKSRRSTRIAPQPEEAARPSIRIAPQPEEAARPSIRSAPQPEEAARPSIRSAPQPEDSARQKRPSDGTGKRKSSSKGAVIQESPVPADAPRATRVRASRKSIAKLQAERRRTSILAPSPLQQEEQVLARERQEVEELQAELKAARESYRQAFSGAKDAYLRDSIKEVEDDIVKQAKSLAKLQQDFEETQQVEAKEVSGLLAQVKSERSAAKKYEKMAADAAEDVENAGIRITAQVGETKRELSEAKDEAWTEKQNLYYFMSSDQIETIQQSEQAMLAKISKLENKEKDEEAAVESAIAEARAEQAKEIAQHKSLLRAEVAAVKGLERSNQAQLGIARNAVAVEGEGILRGEEAVLRGLRRLQNEVQAASMGLPEAHEEEYEVLQRAYPEEELESMKINSERVRLEIEAGKICQDERLSQIIKAKSEVAMENHMEMTLEDDFYKAEVESAKTDSEVEEFKKQFALSSVAPMRKELSQEEDDRERLKREYKQTEFNLRRTFAETTQETFEIGELTGRLGHESEQHGKLAAEFQSLEQASLTWKDEYSDMQEEHDEVEADAENLRRVLRLEEQLSQEAKAQSVRGPEAKAQILAFESTLAQTRIAADAQARAREAAKIADKAEMSALRSALMNEESEVQQLQSASRDQHAAISQMIINKLKEELSRERKDGLNAGDAELQSYARSYKVEVAEASSLRSALLRQEVEVARLNERIDIHSQFGLGPAHGIHPAVSSHALQYSHDMQELMSSEVREQQVLLRLRQEFADAESQATSAAQVALVNEHGTLKSAIAVQQAQNASFQSTLDEYVLSGGNDRSSELRALRAALQNEEAEVLTLRQRALRGGAVADRSGPTAGEVASLRAALRSEELQCQYLLTSQAQSAHVPVSPAPDLTTQSLKIRKESAVIEAAIARERNHVFQLRGQVAQVEADARMMATAPLGDAQAEIAALRSAIKKHTAQQRGGVAAPWTGTHRPGIGGAGGIVMGQPSIDKTYAPIGAVMSGSEVAKMARQIEAAEIQRLTSLLANEEAAAAGARGDNLRAVNEAKMKRVAIKETEAEAAVVRELPDSLSSHAASAGTQAVFAADTASAHVQLARLETEIEKVELQIASLDPADMMPGSGSVGLSIAAFSHTKSEKGKAPDKLRRLQDKASILRVEISEVEAEKESIQVRWGKSEAQHEAVAKADKAQYMQEARLLRSKIAWEEDQMTYTMKRKSVELQATTVRATLAAEEASMRRQLHQRTQELATNMGQSQELGQLQAALAQERAKTARLEHDLQVAEQDRAAAFQRIAVSMDQHDESLMQMKQTQEQVQQANFQMHFVASDADFITEAEAAELDNLKAGHLRENVAASNLRDALADAELRKDTAYSTMRIQEGEIDALRDRMKSEKMDSGFGRREIAEIDTLQGILSQERAACSILRRNCAAVESRTESLKVGHKSEVESTKALLKRKADRDNTLYQSSSAKSGKIAQLEADVQLEERKQQELQQRTDKAEARIYAAESSLEQLELQEEDLVRREMKRGELLADVRVQSAEKAARIIEEQAANWCMQAENTVMKDAGYLAGPVSLPHIVTSEFQIREKLVHVQGEMQLYSQESGVSAIDDSAYYASRLRSQLAVEEHVAQSALAEMHRARAAEGWMLEKSFAEVNDAAARSTEAARQESFLQERIMHYRKEIEAQTDELEDLKLIALKKSPQVQEPATPSHAGLTPSHMGLPLDSMLQAAHGALHDDMDPIAAHDALMALSAPGPSRRTSPAFVDGFPGAFAIGSPAVGSTAAAGSPGAASNYNARIPREPQAMAGHASSLRAQAEGLRGEFRKFQKARTRPGLPSGSTEFRGVSPRR